MGRAVITFTGLPKPVPRLSLGDDGIERFNALLLCTPLAVIVTRGAVQGRPCGGRRPARRVRNGYDPLLHALLDRSRSMGRLRKLSS